MLKWIFFTQIRHFPLNLVPVSTSIFNVWCRYKAMLEIRKLRRQLTNEVNSVMAAGSTMAGSVVLDPSMPPPTEDQARLLRQIVLSGSPDQVAHKVDLDGIEDPKERTRLKYAYMTPDLEEPVFLKSTSVLKNTMPEWITYQEVRIMWYCRPTFLKNTPKFLVIIRALYMGS